MPPLGASGTADEGLFTLKLVEGVGWGLGGGTGPGTNIIQLVMQAAINLSTPICTLMDTNILALMLTLGGLK